MLVIVLCWRASSFAAPTPTPDVVRYEAGRLTVSVVDMPLDRLLAEIAAVTHATVRGSVTARPITIDFTRTALAEGMARIFGAESFMLTYGGDGVLRTITMLGAGPASSPSPVEHAVPPTPRPPLAEEEAQAVVLQRPVTVGGPLAEAVGSKQPPIGRVLHAAVQERSPATRAAAREAALDAMAKDPAVEAAYLSTLVPVEDAVLAQILRGTGPEGAATEWMAVLASRAPSEALRAKAAAVLVILQTEPR
jgi:hypothetical protein